MENIESEKDARIKRTKSLIPENHNNKSFSEANKKMNQS